ncbi:Sulfate transporter/antisigma-factor antagonist STAS [Sulfuricurvum kujiense DSM 16994]|uniref:Sulfate transporter/antisigma-factor antagonist STAS n=1 Tax=Sulfuricurvum kujiense (strain ATCC BAA-921 / DSM 16994 / JCM 11577 / YK-1) TaxID=709032 RepID=E4U2Q0_SULKY|nr:STAS domain-containing protein [Sulfuricurvum kujiense]ADR33635.1 Sulfate transporter/antisigma-factor antagonist STAS [Sulfuricurvum kujiense DSM 16994]
MYKLEFEKLTIYEVESLHKSLLEWCEKSDKELILDLGSINTIDIAAIQLLIAAQKTCEKKSTEFILKNLSAEVQNSMRIAGCDTLFKGSLHD